MRREPILIITAVNVLLQAVVVFIAGFLTKWPKEETAAVIGIVGTTLNFAASFFCRSLATPTAAPQDDTGRPLHA